MPQTVTLLRTPEGGKCYLVGTAHFSLASQEDVSKVCLKINYKLPLILMLQMELVYLFRHTVLHLISNFESYKM